MKQLSMAAFPLVLWATALPGLHADDMGGQDAALTKDGAKLFRELQGTSKSERPFAVENLNWSTHYSHDSSVIAGDSIAGMGLPGRRP